MVRVHTGPATTTAGKRSPALGPHAQRQLPCDRSAPAFLLLWSSSVARRGARSPRCQPTRGPRLWEGAVVVIVPGSGFPTDRASASTPVAHDAQDVVRLADSAPSLAHLDGRSSVCRACPRLVAWREQVAETKRASYAEQVYWGRPVTGWGVNKPRVLILGDRKSVV